MSSLNEFLDSLAASCSSVEEAANARPLPTALLRLAKTVAAECWEAHDAEDRFEAQVAAIKPHVPRLLFLRYLVAIGVYSEQLKEVRG